MRTWSVSGTAFALCTRSSSLSMRTSTSMNPRSLQRSPDSLLVAPAEETAEETGRRLGPGLRFGLGRRHRGHRPGFVSAEHPAAPARAQALEQALRFVEREADVAGGVKLLGERRGSFSLAPGLQLLSELAGVLARKRNAAALAAGEEALESLGLGHSPGFCGVPGRPSGNSSAKRLATTAGTSASTFPPNEAISFTPLEETKLTSGLPLTQRGSAPRPRVRVPG